MKQKNISSSIILILLGLVLVQSACKKSETNTPAGPTNISPASQYQALGFTFLARLDSYTERYRFTNPGYFLTPLDVRQVNNKIYAAWNIEEHTLSMPQGHYTTYFGTIENGKFNKQVFAPCGDPAVSSQYKRVLGYNIDGQGNLFTTYRWYDIHAASLTWQQSFCSSSGLTSGGDYNDYPIEVAENNSLVTGVGGYIYNGLEMPVMKHFKFLGSAWQGQTMSGLVPGIQGYGYMVTSSGNGFLAYTSRSSGELDGTMNLAGFDGVSWFNLGQLSLQGIRKVAGINIQTYYEPFPIRMVRNGENPFILMLRENNTLAVFKFNGTALEMVADQVPFPSDNARELNFCVYDNKLTTYGTSNITGLLDNKRSVYQLNGGVFTLLKMINNDLMTVRGVWSDNSKLWIASETFSANNGLFYSPIDIIELN
ncbi:MAG: hypothetical protein ACOYNC_07990 [Bacteroidales bacterium]